MRGRLVRELIREALIGEQSGYFAAASGGQLPLNALRSPLDFAMVPVCFSLCVRVRVCVCEFK